MKKSFVFLALIVGTGIVTVMGNFIVLYLFGGGGISLGTLASRFVLPALIYVAAISAVLGRNARLFTSPDFQADDEDFHYHLKKIGSVPIKSIAIIVVLQGLFLAIVVFVLGNSFMLVAEVRGFLFGACLAAGMAMGTFVYVISDGLVSKALMSNKITRYPLELREDRQSLKIFIVPVAVAIFAVVFTLTIVVLSLSKEGIDLSIIRNGGWTVTIIVLVVFFLFVTALAYCLRLNAYSLFHSIIAQMENLSEGEKDLSKRIHITSVDELGSIAGMMNSFCANMALSIAGIKEDEKKVFSSSRDLQSNAEEMNVSIGRISSAIAQSGEKANAQMSSVNQASDAIHKITDNIETLNKSITIQSESVSQASASVEEMVGNIASIGKIIEKMTQHFKTVNTAANEGISIQKDSSERVDQIVLQSQTLQTANRMIATISSQTNLLAMNAAIEAAHAGEAGKGFSVVADEIRKLAETSSKESKKISEELKQITNTINGFVKGAESSAAAFSAVSARVNETENLVIEVNNAIKEQQQGAEQILNALERMNHITTEVRTGSNAMQEGNNAMLSEISLLQSQSKNISSGMENITQEIQTIKVGAEAVTKLAKDTNLVVIGIKDLVDAFVT
jgi:methyl-accepting chemotaxis protein